MRCPFVFVVLLSSLLLAGSARAEVRGSWNGQLDSRQLQLGLSFEKHNQIGEALPLEGWSGLESVRSPRAHLTLTREAGTLTLDGSFDRGEGGGGFTFAADPAFMRQLRQNGDSPDEQQLLLLFMFDIGPRYLDAMARGGYPDLSLKELVEAGMFHLGPDRLASYRAAVPGIGFGDALRLAMLKVDTAFIQQLADAGYPHLGADALFRFKMFHVTPEELRAFSQLGYRGLDPETLVSWNLHGVTPEYVKALAAHGYAQLSPDQLVSLRLYGVTPEYLSELERRGEKPADAEDLIRRRLHPGAR